VKKLIYFLLQKMEEVNNENDEEKGEERKNENMSEEEIE
jgi:hypothetical protein